MRQALGKGLDALIRQTQENAPAAGTVAKIAISKIKPNRHQPRKVFNDESISELAQSIKQHGLAQPIVVMHDPAADDYELIAGERRFRACQLAGLDKIDAIIQSPLEQEKMFALSLIENIQREDLNAIDTAQALRKLIDNFGVPQSELARYCGKSKSAISNSLRLLELDENIQRGVQAGFITEGHARALLTVSDKNERLRLYHLAIDKHMTVRELEEAARATYGEDKPRQGRRAAEKAPEVVDFEKNMCQSLGTKVELRPGKQQSSGTLVIHYYSYEELDRIAGRLKIGGNNQ